MTTTNSGSEILSRKTKWILNAALVVICVGILLFLDMNKRQYAYAITILERSAIYAIVAVSMNMVTGLTGLFSLGQAGFMALGAYVTAIFTIPVELRPNVYYVTGIADAIANIELPWVLALFLGGLLAAIVAALVGIPVLRLKSDYLAIATLGFSEIVRAFAAAPQLNRITNGSYGLKSVPGFGSILVPFAVSAACILLMVLLINSSYGRAFRAIRDNEIAAEAMGINLFVHKEMSFVAGSFFAGVAGGMLAMFMRSIDSKNFQVALTYDILLIVVLGGLGSTTGSILGSFLMCAGREWLRFFDDPMFIGGVQIPMFRPGFRMVIFSLLLMLTVLFYRRGLMGSNEFSWDGIARFFMRITGRFKRGDKKPGGGTSE